MKRETVIIAAAMLVCCVMPAVGIDRMRAVNDAQAAEIAELREAVGVLSMEIGAVEEGVRDMLFPPECSVDVGPEAEYVPSYIPALPAAELDLLERVVAAEARGEPYEGIMAVAEAVINRSKLWDMGIAEVLTAPNQFAEPYGGEIADDVKRAVADALAGIKVFRDPITHFHPVSETPWWAEKRRYAGQIGAHKFYC
jgi:N-acetylmuramoyl-L-alanine amidase